MIVKQIEKAVRECSLLERGDHIIVGFSGGADSLALLDGLHRLSDEGGWDLTAVHVHHQLRGKEADEDAAFAGSFCRERGIPFHLRKVDVPGHIERYGGNVQDVARELRYEVFREVAKQVGANKLALGHHADDQAETVLMRFLRGTGAAGLAGIPVKREWDGLVVVRPLWRTWRHEIEAYCRARQLTPRFDSSNVSTDYVRNRVRLELIPQLEEQYNPQLKSGLLQLSEQLAAEEEVWKKWTDEASEKVLLKGNDGEWVLSVPEFRTLSLALQRRVIQLILNYLAIRSWKHIENVRLLANHTSPSARCSLPGNWEAVRDYDKIRFSRTKPARKPQGYDVQLNVPGLTKLEPCGASFEAIVTDEAVEADKWGMRWAVFDAAKVTGTLRVRTRKRGDRIHIIGMDGHKKVKDLFIDEKISRKERDMWPLVTDEADILWIPGLRRSAKALITDDTRQRIYLFYRQEASVHNRDSRNV